MGIGLCHFDLTLKESGVEGKFIIDNPGFEIDESLEYIITYEVNH